MLRRFTVWCTALVMLAALATSGIMGCGGGGGSTTAAGTTAQDVFGSLTVRVSTGGGETAARVVGSEIVVTASSSPSPRRLVVELYPLPLQSPPTPALARGYDLGEGPSLVVVDQIPAPARYLVVGYLYPDAASDYTSYFQVQVEVLPGVITSASAYLTPRPSGSPSVSPSPSPSVGPGPVVNVGTTALPGTNPHLAMRRDGQFVVAWLNSDMVFAQGFSAPPTPAALWGEQNITDPAATATPQAPFPAIDPNDHFGVAWVSHEVGGLYEVGTSLRDMVTGSNLSGVQTLASSIFNKSLAGMGMPGNGTLAGVNWLESSEGTEVMLRRIPVPAGTPATVVTAPGGFTKSLPSMDEAFNGDLVQVYQVNDSVPYFECRLSSNDESAGLTFTVDTTLTPGFSRPSVVIRNGIIAVAWAAMSGGEPNIFVRRFQYTPGNIGAGVTPIDDAPILVNQTPNTSSHIDPDVSMDDSGNFVVVWRDFTQRDPQGDIYGRTFTATGLGRTNFRVNPDTAADYAWPSVGMDGLGRFVVGWGVNPSGGLFARPYPAGFTGP